MNKNDEYAYVISPQYETLLFSLYAYITHRGPSLETGGQSAPVSYPGYAVARGKASLRSDKARKELQQ